MRCILSLDPGTRNTGWAKWVQGKSGVWGLDSYGTSRSPRLISQEDKTRFQIRRVLELLSSLPKPTELWVEEFRQFRPTKAGRHQTGLYYTLLYLPETVKELRNLKVFGVPPATWKVALKKLTKTSSVKDAIRDLVPELNLKKTSSHSRDAVGLGLIAQGIKEKV